MEGGLAERWVLGDLVESVAEVMTPYRLGCVDPKGVTAAQNSVLRV